MLLPSFPPWSAIPLMPLHCLEHPSGARLAIMLLLLELLSPQAEVGAVLLLLWLLVLVLMMALLPLDVEKRVLFPRTPPAGLAPVGNLGGMPGPPMAGLASRLRQV